MKALGNSNVSSFWLSDSRLFVLIQLAESPQHWGLRLSVWSCSMPGMIALYVTRSKPEAYLPCAARTGEV